MPAKGLELRIGKDAFPVEGSIYRLNKPVDGFTYIDISRNTIHADLGFITNEGFVGLGNKGTVVFNNGSVVRIVFEVR